VALLAVTLRCSEISPDGTRAANASPDTKAKVSDTRPFAPAGRASLPAPRSSQYCLRNRTAASLILDRESDRDTVSVAATGLGMVNWAILVEQKKLERKTAIGWCNQAFDSLLKWNPPRNRGWFVHFTNARGEPKPGVEVSTIDTTLLVCGAQRAAEQLQDQALTSRVAGIKAGIDIQWMRRGQYICHGLHWKGDQPEFIPCNWEDYSEGVLIYKFFGLPYAPRSIQYDLPLFVYYYPLCLFDDPELREHLRKAVDFQRKTYTMWGVTACDGPTGYQANRTDIISPLSIYTIAPLIPEATPYLESLKVAPETPAFQPSTGWTGSDRIGINDACCVIMQYRCGR
jgi:hypothetical protein